MVKMDTFDRWILGRYVCGSDFIMGPMDLPPIGDKGEVGCKNLGAPEQWVGLGKLLVMPSNRKKRVNEGIMSR